MNEANTNSDSINTDNTNTDDTETISAPGLGNVPSPSALKEKNRSKYETEHVPVPHECPVESCTVSGFSSFSELRGHFGNMNDDFHRTYNLSIDDYRDD